MEHVIRKAAPRARVTPSKQAVSSASFDWVMVILLALFLGGLHVDGWAHAHGKVDQSFFTPWHALFYSSFGAVTGALGGR